MSSVVITGANRGIGFSLTNTFLKQDNTTKVIATARSPAKATELNDLANKYPGRVHIVALDVDDDKSIKNFANTISKIFDHVDILFNNAGIMPTENPKEVPRKDFIDAFNTNALSAYYVTLAVLTLLHKSSNPRVLNISSLLGSIASIPNTIAFGNGAAYRASKAALNILTATQAGLINNVTIIVAHPGLVDTDLARSTGVDLSKIPMVLKPDESAAHLVKLANNLKLADSGKFFSFDGSFMPW